MYTRNNKNKFIIMIGIMGGISFVLQLMEINIFGFLAIEFSDIPSIIIAAIYGPIPAVLIEIIKNLIKMIFTKTAFIGEIANIIISSAFVIPIGIYFKKSKKRNLILIFILAILSMVIIGAISNYFILIPFYAQFFNGIEGILNMVKPFIPIINSKLDLVLFYITPFNFIKGILISIVSIIFIKIRLK